MLEVESGEWTEPSRLQIQVPQQKYRHLEEGKKIRDILWQDWSWWPLELLATSVSVNPLLTSMLPMLKNIFPVNFNSLSSPPAMVLKFLGPTFQNENMSGPTKTILACDPIYTYPGVTIVLNDASACNNREGKAG